MSALAIVGLACGGAAIVLVVLLALSLGCVAHDSDETLAWALDHRHDADDEPWLGDDAEILDFQLARNRAATATTVRPTTTAHRRP